MPSVQFADPTLFTGGLESFIPNMSRGAALRKQMFDIANAEEDRKLALEERAKRMKLVDADIEMAPLRREAAQLGLAKTKSGMWTDMDVGVERRPVTGSFSQPTLDGTIVELPVNQGMDIVETVEQVNPLTGEKRTVRAKVRRTAEEEERDKRILESREEVARIRAEQAAEAARMRDETERLKIQSRLTGLVDALKEAEELGDEQTAKYLRARIARENTMPGQLAAGTVASRRIEGAAADAGFTPQEASAFANDPEFVEFITAVKTYKDSSKGKSPLELRMAGVVAPVMSETLRAKISSYRSSKQEDKPSNKTQTPSLTGAIKFKDGYGGEWSFKPKG